MKEPHMRRTILLAVLLACVAAVTAGSAVAKSGGHCPPGADRVAMDGREAEPESDYCEEPPPPCRGKRCCKRDAPVTRRSSKCDRGGDAVSGTRIGGQISLTWRVY
jgi:hypothetical protein